MKMKKNKNKWDFFFRMRVGHKGIDAHPCTFLIFKYLYAESADSINNGKRQKFRIKLWQFHFVSKFSLNFLF